MDVERMDLTEYYLIHVLIAFIGAYYLPIAHHVVIQALFGCTQASEEKLLLLYLKHRALAL